MTIALHCTAQTHTIGLGHGLNQHLAHASGHTHDPK
jgi:hypothetical protein